MRIAELAAAAVIGALLMGVGYELGRSGTSVVESQVQQIDREALAREIDEKVEAEVARRQREFADAVIAQVEELLSEMPRPYDIPELKPGPEGEEPRQSRIEELGKELDELIAKHTAELEQQKALEEERRRREPFDAATLRRFEEARKKLLEERERKREQEEKRK